ncbi:MAG TPA: hypothetical protein VKB27_09700, partial [Gammaproteobacteria bacterium]|nr:hypothetical protein [Gammaproteobacteria bacterium]
PRGNTLPLFSSVLPPTEIAIVVLPFIALMPLPPSHGQQVTGDIPRISPGPIRLGISRKKRRQKRRHRAIPARKPPGADR